MLLRRSSHDPINSTGKRVVSALRLVVVRIRSRRAYHRTRRHACRHRRAAIPGTEVGRRIPIAASDMGDTDVAGTRISTMESTTAKATASEIIDEERSRS